MNQYVRYIVEKGKKERKKRNKFVPIFKILQIYQIHFIGAKFTRPFPRLQYFRRVIHQLPLQNRSTVRNRIESSKTAIKNRYHGRMISFPIPSKISIEKTRR